MLNIYYYGVYLIVGLPVIAFIWPWMLFEDGIFGLAAWLFYHLVQIPFEFLWDVATFIWDIIVEIWDFFYWLTSLIYNWIVSNIYTLLMESYTLQYAYISNDQAWLNDEAPFDGSIFYADNPDF